MTGRISSKTFTHHTIRVEWADFMEKLDIPPGLKPFSVWIRYDGGKHVDIDCSGSPPESGTHTRRRGLRGRFRA